MTPQARGAFDVKVTPQPPDDFADGKTVSRMTIDKKFHGDLEATSRGQMLAAGTDVKGSAVYVAVERVTGTLHGKRGSFSLHHTGIMTRGTPELTVSVVPDSGTEELTGISGTMVINITGGKHEYDFDYRITV